jgi:hypothetical protein
VTWRPGSRNLADRLGQYLDALVLGLGYEKT